MQISTQTDNHKHRKNIAIEKTLLFGKWILGFETLNSTFYANQEIF